MSSGTLNPTILYTLYMGFFDYPVYESRHRSIESVVCVCVCDRFKIEQFDTGISYPDDPRKEPRDKELELMKNIYQYGQTAPDLPVQVSRTSVHFGSMPRYAIHKHDL